MCIKDTLSKSIRHVCVAALLISGLATHSFASESDRITQLEIEVQQLKQRLSSLERPPVSGVASPKPLASSEGWRQLANWRSLKKGMSHAEVRSLLGEPQTVSASGPFTDWSYSNRGDIRFVREKLDGWTEPRQ
ncbi:MAG: hypothetical protein QE494_13720 [Ramlibacter sp.]|uniref:hypothetical protein n=1 Tax=Ramlibacter sp. TaxID=1917967 RepID=UPI002631250C|nr:hypothetical protein [Ramlibacter sp.]MDH4377349.1 hypothetical protein [Ramlibacter sp.]